MENPGLGGEADVKEARSRRGWMLMAASLGAALALGACGKNHKNKDDEDEEDPPPAT
ncbi:MAG: hypothetical protein U1E67_06805 [Hyphomicrobiales bacterium]